MSDIIKICGIAMIAVTICAVLKHQNSPISKYISEISALLILLSVIASLEPMIDMLKSAFDFKVFSFELIPIVLKTAATAIICQIVTDICKENGENMLSGAVEFAGNAAIILMSLPIIKSFLSDVFAVLKS